MTSPYKRFDSTAPFGKGVAVVTSDTTVIPQTDALWIGTAGNLTVTMADGNDAVLNSVPAGRLDIAVVKVKAASTAAGIVALYRTY